MAAPADLSTCDVCGRRTPPSNNPEFAHWVVVKNEGGQVTGMRCPRCQLAEGVDR